MNTKNKYGIKIDDIFYISESYGTVVFFQVVGLRGTTGVVLKEIEFKEVSEDENGRSYVVPDKNNFVKNSFEIEFNNVGTNKIVKQYTNKDGQNIIYIPFNIFYNRNRNSEEYTKISYYQQAYLWDGEPLSYRLDYLD